jgi:glucosamine--fructose-6-phosphate aminotransferase (isomerizing)
MCGIMGYVGEEEAWEVVIEGLRKLEYRGYDSSGVAVVSDGKMHVRRRKGKLGALVEVLRAEPLKGHLAIGHTRWATHGRPSDENAHPHCVDDIAVVHNGIIENYLVLSEKLRGMGRVFESETDTEIIAHLVAVAPGASLKERVKHALAQVHGAYAIAVISTREPQTMIVAKNASPLVIGVCDNAGIVASDIPALLPYTRKVIALEEGELATVGVGFVHIETLAGKPVQRQPRVIEWSPVMAEKGGYKHFMHKEIHEQPRAMTDTLRGRLDAQGRDVVLDEGLLDLCAKAQRVVFTACGTSMHACMMGRLAFEEWAGIACETDLASELRYRPVVWGPGTVVLTVSQSGETADTLAALRMAKARGSKIVSVVNVLDSSIARESDHVLYTMAGPEIGVASTKAFITQVTALLLLAIGIGRKRGVLAQEKSAVLLDALRHVPLHIEAVLKQESSIVSVAHGIAKARSALFLGRGYGYPVALEGALKLKEVSYIHAEGYAAGEMKHGPIALVEAEVPIVAVATQGPLYEKIFSNIQEVKARDGRVIAVASEGDTHIQSVADEVFYIPALDPVLDAMIATVPLQLLAYHVADARGTDVDQPRNLAKSVTVE